jgi:hypothetical protein
MRKNSQYPHDIQNHQKSRDHYKSDSEPLLCLKPGLKIWLAAIAVLISTIFAVLDIVLPVLFTGDLGVLFVRKMETPVKVFLMGLGWAVLGSWIIINLPKTMATFLFFNNHMEIRPFLFGKKLIYPYEIMEVRQVANHLIIGKGYRIVSNRMTWEKFAQAKDILREKAQNFHTDERKDAKSRLKSLKKWLYLLLLISTVWSVFVVWYILQHR